MEAQTNFMNLLHLIKTGFSYLVPDSCLLCGIEQNQILCSECHAQFFEVTSTRCVFCAIPVGPVQTRCGQCLTQQPAYDFTTVACDYIAPLDQLVLSLKFGHQLPVAPALATLLANSVKRSTLNLNSLPDLFIPVPLSRERLAQRGFNQALEIAKPLAKALSRPIYPKLLLRVRDTTAQTLLHPDQRHENIMHAFSPNAHYKDKIEGQHVGVIDDVMTTGATLHEIAACLKRHGARTVSNFVFARTPPH